MSLSRLADVMNNQFEDITAVDYQRFIASGPLVLVHFWAAWAGSQFVFKDAIATAIAGSNLDVRHGMWDVDNPDSRQILKDVQVVCVPTVLYYKNGAPVAVQPGFRKADEMMLPSI